MFVIKDAIHGGVHLNELELSLLDSPEMQRLRGVKQLAMAHLVYPGANHTRFEHSLGTMHVTGKICEQIEIEENETRDLRIAALLHDIGHPAFSHECEQLVENCTGKSHEKIASERIRTGAIKELLTKNGISSERVAALIGGSGLGEIITSDLGADRIDYLLRDSHYTGVAYGVVDFDRLIETMKAKDKKLILDEAGIEAAESLLIARFLMFSTVYLHHTCRIANGMLSKAVSQELEKGRISADDLIQMSDSELLSKIRENRLVNELLSRRLYKRAFEVDWQGLSEKVKKSISSKSLEREICEKAGVLPEDLLVDSASGYRAMKRVTISVQEASQEFSEKKGEIKPLDRISELVASIARAEEKRLKLVVAARSDKREKVMRACAEIFKKL